ncbi:MAG TPA: DUF4426 domain-containing protein [Gammaproteobacteria bacterium]|nr:DUF4426 domain-containing protein [Gammaproteobacteria bacterium]
MVSHIRGLYALGALVLAAGCDQAAAPAVTAVQDNILRGTDPLRDFGDYVVYINALMTDQLTPDVAEKHGIVRSKNRALLTVSIHRKQPNGATAAVAADISASAVNLSGQLRAVLLREVREEAAIYYIGELAVNDTETLLYTLNMTPVGEADSLTLRYQRQFFVAE